MMALKLILILLNPSDCFHRFLRYYGRIGLPAILLTSSLVPLVVRHTLIGEMTGSQLFYTKSLSKTSPGSQTGGCRNALTLTVVAV